MSWTSTRHASPPRTVWAYHEIIEGILRGKIKGLWVVCTNPAHSWINQNHCRDMLDRLDFLVVQDMYHTTETARTGRPRAAGRRLGREGRDVHQLRAPHRSASKKVRRAPGQALSDFSIFRLIADAWGCGEMFRELGFAGGGVSDPQGTLREQPCDITGIEDYRMLDAAAAFSGRCARADNSNLSDGSSPMVASITPMAGRSFCSRIAPAAGTHLGKVSLLLLTGRGTASQWHTQTRTASRPCCGSCTPSICSSK